MLERLNATLAGRYTVERELGRGGMASVWLARDLRHERPVAIKVLRAELAGAIGVDRFLREIRLTAALQHPHIVPVLDSGLVEDGEGNRLPWYVMPYVAGESLRERLQRERAISRSSRRSRSPRARPARWPRHTGSASCTATSSRRICCWPAVRSTSRISGLRRR